MQLQQNMLMNLPGGNFAPQQMMGGGGMAGDPLQGMMMMPPSPLGVDGGGMMVAQGGGADPNIYGPYYTKPIPPNVLSITINKSDTFRVRVMCGLGMTCVRVMRITGLTGPVLEAV